MTDSLQKTECVEGDQMVRLQSTLFDVTTEDGNHLIVTRKQPIDREPLAPILLVHGLGQNRYSWTLPSRSMENFLVQQGFETFNAELRGHGLSRAAGSEYPQCFETYLDYDLPAIMSAISQITGGKRVFYIGHSLGGAISYCIGARFQEQLAGIVSFAGPYSMSRGNPTMRSLAKAGVLLSKIVPVKALHPRAFYIDLLGIIARHGLFLLDSRKNRIPIQVWYPGSIERPILLERIERGFDRTSFNVFWLLVEWAGRGELLNSEGSSTYEDNISDLMIPILFILGDRDYAVPPSSVRGAYDRVGTSDKTFKVFGGEEPNVHFGHCDLICGRHAPQIVWPYLLQWLDDRV